MEEHLLNELADYIYNAQRIQKEVQKLTVELAPNLSVADAYQVQSRVIDKIEAAGHHGKVLAPKLGLTSKAKMQQMGVEAPIYGYVFEDMVVSGDVVKVSDHIHPKVEPEIGVVLKNDLKGPGITKEDVLANIDYVFSCAEIIDSRYQNFDFDLPSVIADNTSASGAVFSPAQHSIEGLDLAAEKVTLRINGEIKAEGDGTAVLGHPAEPIAVLANLLAEKGEYVKAGEPIMTGGMTQAFIIKPGYEVELTYSNLAPITFKVVE